MSMNSKRQELPDSFVMDAMANDIESVDDVLRTLNSKSDLGWTDVWGRQFTEDEVIGALIRLVRTGLVLAYAPIEGEAKLAPLAERALPQALGVAYFGLTERGRIVHANWDAPDGPSQGEQ